MTCATTHLLGPSRGARLATKATLGLPADAQIARRRGELVARRGAADSVARSGLLECPPHVRADALEDLPGQGLVVTVSLGDVVRQPRSGSPRG